MDGLPRKTLMSVTHNNVFSERTTSNLNGKATATQMLTPTGQCEVFSDAQNVWMDKRSLSDIFVLATIVLRSDNSLVASK